MVALWRRQRSSASASASMAVESDPTRVPGKPFLEHLYRVLDTSGGDDSDHDSAGPLLRSFRLSSTKKLLARQHEGRLSRPLVVEASCLCYLQQLFHAMLTPTTSPHSGLVTQWRLSTSFAQQLEEDLDGTANMGAASPEKILQLAGRLLEVDSLYITNSSLSATLPMPSNCDLAMLPNLSRLNLDGVDLDSIRGFASVSEIVTELRFSNKPIDSLAALLLTNDPPTKWLNLRSLCVDSARLSRVDSTSISCVPNLESVILTNNELEDLGALTQCDWLSAIDVSHNRIHSLDIASGVFEYVKQLNLSHNHITSIHSLCHLQLLEVLDLCHNLIHNFDEIQALTPLSRLHSLFLHGNPVSKLTKYRQTIRKLLSEEVLLDSVPWKAQDLEDFTRGNFSSSEGLKLLPTRDITESAHVEDAKESTSFDKWWVARGVGSSGLVIGFAQLFVSLLWSRDVNAERLTLSIMGATAALSVVTVLLTLVASWLYRWWSLGSKCSEADGSDYVTSSPDKSSTQPLKCLELSAVTPLNSSVRSISADSVLSLDDFSAALDDASGAGEDVTVSQLVSLCAHLQVCVAYWSRHETSGLGFAWLRLDRAMSTLNLSASDVGSSELLRERLSSRMTQVLDAEQPSQSPATALAKLVPVIHFGAIVLSSLRVDGSLQQCLRDAYVHAFASSHSWWRQRALLAPIGPMPATESFLEWIHASHVCRDNHRLFTAVQRCGERLHLLHTCLVDLVDEHEHSFVYSSQ